MKIEFRSQRRQMLLLLTTNMATVPGKGRGGRWGTLHMKGVGKLVVSIGLT